MSDALLYTPYASPVLLAAAMTGSLSVYLARRRRALGATWLLLLMISVTWWAGCYALELMTLDPAWKVMVAQAKYPGIVVTPIAWLAYALIYTGRGWLVTRRHVLLASMLPATIALLALTNAAHGLLWRDPVIVQEGPLNALAVTYAPLFWLHTAYAYALLALGLALLVGFLRRSHGVARQQAAIMVLGASVPFAGNAVTLLAPGTLNGLDLTPIGLTASGLCFAWEFLRLGLLQRLQRLEPPARIELDADVEWKLSQSRHEVLELLVRGTVALGLITVIPTVLQAALSPRDGWLRATIYVMAYALVLAIARLPRRVYRVRAFAFVLVWYLFGVCAALLFGLELDAGIPLFAFAFFTFLLFGTRWSLAALGLTTVTSAILIWLALAGSLASERKYLAGGAGLDLLAGGLVFVLATGVALIAIHRLQQDTAALIERSRELTGRLEHERALLETRVATRTRALEASFAISRHIGSITAIDQLLGQVSAEIERAYGFRHVLVYRHAGGRLLLEGGTEPLCSRLRRQAHQLVVGQGPAGQAAASGALVHAQAARPGSEWLAHPLLSDSRDELAVPILLGDRLLGVLDLHAEAPRTFDEATSAQMQSIASQLAIALQKHALHQAARRRAMLETRLNEITQNIRHTTSPAQARRLAARDLGRALGHGQVVALVGSAVEGAPRKEMDHAAPL